MFKSYMISKSNGRITFIIVKTIINVIEKVRFQLILEVHSIFFFNIFLHTDSYITVNLKFIVQ